MSRRRPSAQRRDPRNAGPRGRRGPGTQKRERPEIESLAPEAILRALRATQQGGAPQVVSLPGGGELYQDHPVPFLVVYRRPPVHPDPGTERLVRGEAAYLIAPGRGDALAAVRALLAALAAQARERFGAFLVLELWTEAPKGTDGVPDPRFRVLASGRPELTPTVEALVRGLGQARLRGTHPEVSVVRGARIAPPRMRPLLGARDAESWGCHLVGLALSPCYRDGEGTVFPMLLARLRRLLSVAIRRGAYRFAKTRAQDSPVSYQAYGTSALGKDVLQVDERLAAVSRRYDFLVSVTPTNAQAAWREFRRNRLARAPKLDYPPLHLDPILIKRELFSIPIERVADPTLADLFREKQLALDRELTLLIDRDTPRFLPGSLQLYGGVEDTLYDLALQLVQAIPPAEPGETEPTVDAEAFAARARQEVAHYQAQGPGFDARVELRESLYTDILTSHGVLLVGTEVRVPESAVEPYIHHEIGTHALTYHNGRAQPLQLFVLGLPGYDELQEGLAVLSEYLAGGLSPTRLRWLAGRVLAVRMMTEGASFVEVFRALHETHGFLQERAFAITVRVMRGGGLTKDAVYLRGLVHVLEHLRDNYNMDVLYVGKMAVRHIPMIEELHLRRVLVPPRFRPRYLLDYQGQERLRRVRQGLSVLDLVEETTCFRDL